MSKARLELDLCIVIHYVSAIKKKEKTLWYGTKFLENKNSAEKGAVQH